MSVTLLIPDDASSFPSLLLELTVAGVVYRFAELGPLDVADGADVLHFHGGLLTSPVEETIDLWGNTATARSISVQVLLGTGLTLQDLLQAGGEELMAATARLLLWDGGEYDDCQVAASGRVSAPFLYGEPGEPESISFAIDRDLVDHALIPPAEAYLREDSFQSATTGQADEDDIGAYYPIIIGRPGYGPSPLGGRFKAAPTVRANIGGVSAGDQRIVVALGRVSATSIKVWSSANNSTTVPIVEDTDDYGIVVSYADVSGEATPTTWTAQGTGPTVAGWGDDGTLGLDGGGLHALGDVVIWALQQASIAEPGVDWERVHGAREALNALGRIDTFIDERISPLEWLTGQVLAYFPVFVADAGSGIYAGVWRYDAQPSDAILTIDTSLPGYERTSAVSWGSADVANEISLEGGFSVASSGHLISRRWSGSPDLQDEEHRGHPLLSRSRALFGARELTASIPVVEDPATLDRIGAYLAYRHAMPRAEVGYRIPWRKAAVELGAVVAVEDGDVGLAGRLGIITGRRYSAGALEIRVNLLPQV